MGLTIKSELETNMGNTYSPYVVISSYSVSKTSAEISYRINYFSNKEYWKQSLPTKISELALPKNLPINATFSPGIILYKCKKEWVEATLPQFFRVKLAEKKVIEIPITKKQEVVKEVPYISFDENGDEITKYREKKVIEEVEIGKEKVEEEIINYDLFDNPIAFAYTHLKKELEKLLVGVKIEDN